MARKKWVNKLYTLDTETIGLGGAIKRIALYDGKEIYYGYKFEDIEPILDAAYADGIQPRVYIHNIEFDARKMNIFRPGNVNWNTTVLINNKYARITCQHYTLHDSYKLLPMSLDKLSKDFQLEHGKMDLWKEVQEVYPGQYESKVDFFNRCDPDDPVYVKYLGYDVISLYELMEKIMDLSGLGLDEMVNRVSTASLSKYLLKHGYKGEKFKSPYKRKTDYEYLTSYKAWSSKKLFPPTQHLPDPYNKLTYQDIENKIREGYYGGRTEVFTPYMGQPGWFFDVNSLYPSCFDKQYPIDAPTYYINHKNVKARWEQWLCSRSGLGFIKAKVYVPFQHIPPLPTKMGKLVFPTGHIKGTWAYHELLYAVENCGVIIEEFEEMIHFKNTFPVFKRFCDKFYPMKVEGNENNNKSLASFAKLILNTGYGWTALSREGKTELKNLEPEKEEKYQGRIITKNTDLGYLQIESIVVSDSVQVAVGAYVTVYARLILLDMLRRMDAIGTVYYCDTDSIVCSHPIPDEYVHPTRLGAWGLESQPIEGIFLFPKVYAAKLEEAAPEDPKTEKAKVKFKGVTRETQKGFNFAYYEEILEKLKNDSKEEIIVEEGKELLRSMIYAQNRGIDANNVELRDKRINLANIQKRNMDYAGNSSQPWHFENLHEFETFKFTTPIRPWKEYGNEYDPFSQPG